MCQSEVSLNKIVKEKKILSFTSVIATYNNSVIFNRYTNKCRVFDTDSRCLQRSYHHHLFETITSLNIKNK